MVQIGPGCTPEAIGAAALVTQRQLRSAGQTQTLIDPLEQQHATIADDVATIACGLDYTPASPSDPSELDGPIGTLWHWQSSVARGRDTYDNGLSHEAADLLLAEFPG